LGFISNLREDLRYFGWRKCFFYFASQRILRINSEVPWKVHPTSQVKGWDKIVRADRWAIPGASPGCYIQAINGIEMGKNIIIGPGVAIVSANHDLNDFTKHEPARPIKIGDNCWLGANCVILPGVHLSEHTIVAAGAVVVEDSPPNCVIGGVPAKVIKTLPNYGEKG
jgi:NDP-sugar pyrophosphorylase family protein